VQITPGAKKIAIFVDVQNIYYTTREAYGRQFNYRKLWNDISLQGEIVVANAYATNRNHNGQERFQEALRHIGFKVKLKPYIQRSDGSAKGDWDVGITIDILDLENQVDIVILLSGDGDFDLLIARIKEHQSLEAIVYGVPFLTAQSLVDAASQFIPIDQDFLI